MAKISKKTIDADLIKEILDSGDLEKLKALVNDKPTRKQKRPTKASPIPGRPPWNPTWVDDMKDHADEDVRKNPSLGYQGPRHNRDKERQTNNTVKVQCSVCKKWEEISPLFAASYDEDPQLNTYRCNDCLPGQSK